MLTPGANYFVQICHWVINFGSVLTLLTNEIHKWAHVHSKPHPMVRFLQNAGLILSHEHHHRHHQNKFDQSYCLINGWMDPVLEKLDFWRRSEYLITKLTGAVPRVDDKFWRSIEREYV